LIPGDEIRRDPSRTAIPFYCVDAVCEVPFGSYPANMPYEYFSDEEHLRRWLQVEESADEHLRFLDEYIFGVPDFNGYLQKCGGLERMRLLRQQELLLDRGR
jgi:glutaconate CoA-transferase subunit A